MDHEALNEVWRAELLARLKLLDETISEQARRVALFREKGWDATVLEKRSKLLAESRQHYVALLNRLLFDGELPILWND